MALAVLPRAFKVILKALQKFEVSHLSAEMVNIKIWVPWSFSHNFLYYLHFIMTFIIISGLDTYDPTNWCHLMLTCVYDKHSIPNKLFPRVIICKFYHSKEFVPLIMQCISIMSQYVLNDAVYPLRLSIGLRMKCNGHSQPCPHGPCNAF